MQTDESYSRINSFVSFQSLSELFFPFCIVLLCMWCSDYRHVTVITDAEFGGEPVYIVTQMHLQIFILWDLIPYSLLMPWYYQSSRCMPVLAIRTRQFMHCGPFRLARRGSGSFCCSLQGCLSTPPPSKYLPALKIELFSGLLPKNPVRAPGAVTEKTFFQIIFGVW